MSKRSRAAKRAYRAAKRIGDAPDGMKTWARRSVPIQQKRMSMPLRGGAIGWTIGDWLDAKAHPTRKVKALRVVRQAAPVKAKKPNAAKTDRGRR